MAEQRILAALSRIDRALLQIETSPRAQDTNADDRVSIERFNQIRNAAGNTIRDIDKLLSTLANGNG